MATEDDFYMGDDGAAGMGDVAGEDAAMDDGGALYDDDQGDEGFDHWCVPTCPLQARADTDPPGRADAAGLPFALAWREGGCTHPRARGRTSGPQPPA